MINSRKGSVLIVALWAMIFFSMAAATLGVRARMQISVVKRFKDAAAARATAVSGIEYVSRLVGNEAGKNPDSPALVFWRDDKGLFKDISLFPGSEERFSIGYTDAAGTFYYGLDDEESRINLNTVSAEVLTRIYSAASDEVFLPPEKLAAQTIEWRERKKGRGWGMGDGEGGDGGWGMGDEGMGFGSVEELLLVPGMTLARWEALKPHLTVWGSGQVNLNTVSKETLLLLGISEPLALRLIEYRITHQAEAAAQNKLVSVSAQISETPAFSDLGDAKQKVHVTPEEDTELQNIASVWTFDSETFRFTALTRRDEKSAGGLECLVDRKGRLLLIRDASGKFQLSGNEA